MKYISIIVILLCPLFSWADNSISQDPELILKNQKLGETTKLDIDNPECVVRGPDGKIINLKKRESGEQILIPKGSKITSACFPDLLK